MFFTFKPINSLFDVSQNIWQFFLQVANGQVLHGRWPFIQPQRRIHIFPQTISLVQGQHQAMCSYAWALNISEYL